MPKKYEYIVFLAQVNTNSITYETVFLDHPISELDFINFEGHPRRIYIVTDYKLVKVTGTFAYNVTLWKYPEHGYGRPSMGSMVTSLDHQITEKTIKADFIQFEKSFFKDKELSRYTDKVKIISFQEIPDE